MDAVSYLINLKTKVVLDIQRELINGHKRLEMTSAGRVLWEMLQEANQKYVQELSNLEHDRKEAIDWLNQEIYEELS